MTNRRDWTQFNGQVGAARPDPSDFAHWVLARLDGTPQVHDVGSGASADLRLYAEHGCQAIGHDYAHPGRHALGGDGLGLPEGAGRRSLNLLDGRDVLVAGALAARHQGPVVVTSRRVLEAVPPRARESVWRFAAMALSGGGVAFVEGMSRSPKECRRWAEETGGPRLWPVDPTALEPLIKALGGTIVHREGLAAAARASRTGTPARWRMMVEWPPQEEGTS